MKIIWTLWALLVFTANYAQDKAAADKWIGEGISLHDKGDYAGAIDKYNKALEADRGNVLAGIEKAMSLNAAKRYEEAIAVSKAVLEEHSEGNFKTLYVTYANALDHLNRTDEALLIYDRGIERFPDFYQLYFNKGIAYSNSKRYDEAVRCFQKSFLLNPNHGSSLNALGVLEMQTNRIASILAFSRFLIVEPQTSRSTKNLENIQASMMKGVTQTGKKTVNINIDAGVLRDSIDDKPKLANDFSSTDLILSMASALDFDKKNRKSSEVEKFIRKFEVICESMEELQAGNLGFYWEVLSPYFIEMKNKEFIETFGYIAFANQEDEDVAQWHKKNKAKVAAFYDWSNRYTWPK
ncbi:tetratricopeptide repeat protein [Flavobacterium sp. JP2137]|uniref:tetratricopeptide repeat protein n=1 Tax=Flavobacterium sp. JP2137 TaxID=3414510 RepID=UPI003D2FF398